MHTLHLSQDPAADALLSEDPLALLIGMLLDQQIPMEKAFRGPQVLLERLGSLHAGSIADYDVDAFAALFAATPAIHRFPGSMAGRVQDLCRVLATDHDGDAERVWTGVTSGGELLDRLESLPGFGRQKAQIFLALLGKQCGVRPTGWRNAAGDYGKAGVFRSVADVTGPASLQSVRAYKQSVKKSAKAKG